MLISAIAAIGQNRELGANNQLLWHIPEDLKHFHDLTVGHPIIMGRKTYESIGRTLPGRINIVITRDPKFKIEGGIVVHSLDEAINVANQESASLPGSWPMQALLEGGRLNPPAGGGSQDSFKVGVGEKHEVFIIGGGQIFNEAMSMVQRLYLTIVHASFPDADTFFPDYSMFTKVLKKEDRESDKLKYTFLTLER